MHHIGQNIGGGGVGVDYRKIEDLQSKIKTILYHQNQLNSHTAILGSKIQRLQYNLIKTFAHRLSTLTNKTSIYIQTNTSKLHNLSLTAQNIPQLPQHLTTQLIHLKQQINLLKTKQFQYDNIHIGRVQERIGEIRGKLEYLENIGRDMSKVNNVNTMNNTVYSRNVGNIGFSRISNQSSLFLSQSANQLLEIQSSKNNHINGKAYNRYPKSINSSLFDDYHGEQFSELDSIQTDGEFFHPMSSSFQKHPSQIIPQKTLHNNSFQNFTSQDQQQQDHPYHSSNHTYIHTNSLIYSSDSNSHQNSHHNSHHNTNTGNNETQNEIRIKRMFINLRMKLPVRIEGFADGRVRIYGNQFLADQNDQFLRVSREELRRLRVAGFVEY